MKKTLVETTLKSCLLFKVSRGKLNRSSQPKEFCLKGVRESLWKTTVQESLLKKCQAGGLQPYLKRDFDTDFFSL